MVNKGGPLIEDPSYATGVLVGRKQALMDVIDRLLAPDVGHPETIVAALVKWCAQTDQEIEDELHSSFLRSKVVEARGRRLSEGGRVVSWGAIASASPATAVG